ncbi:hypothetical protein [uncultured Ruegeria sp.]|uniref:hypothetical protein n=1 Tax=uncultured Ruegeria sp. TaxID=259304 RepID=UPI0026354399|nr:hypothetical protein [uncultured Ruegeria sp.]
MARLTLNPDFSLKDIGCEVLRAARARALGERGDEEKSEEKIREMIVEREQKEVTFVYDSKDRINIIIPDLSDKVTEDKPDYESWCCDLAYEAMGGIVVYGCSS